MKNPTFNIILLILLTISLIGAASATTLVAGKIYNADFTQTIPEAFVQLVCTRTFPNGSVTTTAKNTTSLADGTYAFAFKDDTKSECTGGDVANVFATKGNLYGEKSGYVNPNVTSGWNIAIINVPLVPEFGLFVGALTLIAAIVIFFIVRQE